MAFSIAALLYDKMSCSKMDSNSASEVIEDGGNPMNESISDSEIGQQTIEWPYLSLNSVTSNMRSPTLLELQMLLGLVVRKHEYKRVRKASSDRKPRQAYSSQQLRKLENEFEVSSSLWLSEIFIF
ncbi:hypothetical protein AB6A40_006611 [Gnathostoma spinigerum]|uniref:Uncharacterized protein n=1 Tax=Gnathostoma spinigerum TaxID=75299 RepID=A0ABD6EL18_9BILA